MSIHLLLKEKLCILTNLQKLCEVDNETEFDLQELLLNQNRKADILSKFGKASVSWGYLEIRKSASSHSFFFFFAHLSHLSFYIKNYVYVCFACIHAYAPHMCSALGSQKRVSDTLNQKNCCCCEPSCGRCNQTTHPSEGQPLLFTPEPSLSSSLHSSFKVL